MKSDKNHEESWRMDEEWWLMMNYDLKLLRGFDDKQMD